MKKWLALIAMLAMVIALSACSFGVDKTAINNVVTRIAADELDSAINLVNSMNGKTLSAGKSKILKAVIQELNSYLNFNSWVSTDYEFVDERAIRDIEKYQTIVNALSLDPNESNVDDFIVKALELKPYTKWNSYHVAVNEYDFADIMSLMDQGATYKSNPSIASKYYQQAYKKCMNAYNNIDGEPDYGMQEMADFYYNFAIQTKSIIDQTETTNAQDNAYNAAASAYKAIQNEHLDAYDDVIAICDSFPKKLF